MKLRNSHKFFVSNFRTFFKRFWNQCKNFKLFLDLQKYSARKFFLPFCTFFKLRGPILPALPGMIKNVQNFVEISKAGDVNKTSIWTVLKNAVRCATVYQGTLCTGICYITIFGYQAHGYIWNRILVLVGLGRQRWRGGL